MKSSRFDLGVSDASSPSTLPPSCSALAIKPHGDGGMASPNHHLSPCSESETKIPFRPEAVVYIIGLEGGPFKIGMSINPAYRLREFQKRGKPRLKVFAAYKVAGAPAHLAEHHAHCVLEGRGVAGKREWFDVSLEEAHSAIQQGIEAAVLAFRVRKPATIDLSPGMLASIAPGLSLAQLGQLAEPPIERAHLCRLRSGRQAPIESVVQRLDAAMERARELHRTGRLVLPKSSGRPRKNKESAR